MILIPLSTLAFLFRPALNFLQPEFASAAPAAVTLYLSVLASIATIPLTTALYALRRPHVETYLELANLVVLVAMGALFIRLLPDAAFGAALALLIQRVLDFGAMAVLVRRAILRGKVAADVERM